MRKEDGRRLKGQSVAAVRASIGFPPEIDETLEMIAKEERASLAWVVRQAIVNCNADKWPILKGQG